MEGQESCQPVSGLPSELWFGNSLGGPGLVPSQNKQGPPLCPSPHHGRTNVWHPRPLLGPRDLISVRRTEAAHSWADQNGRAGGWEEKSWKLPLSGHSAETSVDRGRMRGLEGRTQPCRGSCAPAANHKHFWDQVQGSEQTLRATGSE